MIASPRIAARFVSCIEDVDSNDNLGHWRSYMSTALSKKCNSGSRACFLVGILNNSFALDSWVVSGTKVENGNLVQHCWVVQRDSGKRVTFIEPSSAKRYTSNQKLPYKQIFSVFNETKYYSNIQDSDLLSRSNFDFENRSSWNQIDPEVEIPRLSPSESSNLTCIQPSNLKTLEKIESELNFALQETFSNYRSKNFGIKFTNLDEKLNKILSVALSDYEFERAYCCTPSPEQIEFVDSVKRITPKDCTFKAKPRFYKGLASVGRIMADFVKDISVDQDVKTIFMGKKAGSKFGVRVKVVSYAEDVVCTWVCFAIIF